MSRIWKIIGLIVLAAVVIGAVCLAVGIFTGAEYTRIYAALDARYHITMYWEYFQTVFGLLSAQL